MIDATRLAPNLWIGSKPPPGDVLAKHGFHTVVLCAREWQPEGLYRGVEVIPAGFHDDPDGLDTEDLETALWSSGVVAHRILSGRRCLVTCWQGRNRSGLVCALALTRAARIPPNVAGEIVRAQRPFSLTNPAFRRMLGM